MPKRKMIKSPGYDLLPQDLADKWMWDPLKFFIDIIPWKQVGTQYQRWERPAPWIIDVLKEFGEKLRRRARGLDGGDGPVDIGPMGMCIASGHGVHKSSAFIPGVTAWALFTRPYSNGIMTASSEEQLKSKAWGQLKVLMQTSKVLNRIFIATDKYICERGLRGEASRGMRPEWGIIPMCPDPSRYERMLGVHSTSCSLAVFEESEGVPDPNYYAMDGINGDPFALRIAVGNPLKNTGWFPDVIEDRGKSCKDFQIVRSVDVRDMPGRSKNWLQRTERDIQANGGEDSDWCRSRIRGLVPRTTKTQYIPEPLCREAQERTREALLDKHSHIRYEGSPIQMAVDLAHGGDNETVVMYRTGWDAGSFPIFARRGRMMNPNEAVHHIRECFDMALKSVGEDQRWSRQPVFAHVDCTGTGSEILHALHQMGGRYMQIRPVIMSSASPDPTCLNFRAYCWMKALQFLSKGGRLPLGPRGERLVKELCIPTFSHKEPSGKLVIEKKADIKTRNNGKSIDYADTFTMLCLGTRGSIEREFVRRAARSSGTQRGIIMRRKLRRAGRPWRGA